MTTAEERPAPARARHPARLAAWSPRRRDALAYAIVAIALLLPLWGLLHAPGPPMEEGFMLTFPERVLAGDIPNRDFLHLYGPGSLWVLAAVYRVLGTDLVVERLFGLLQHAGLVMGLYFMARWWGRRVALTCALLGLVISLPAAGLTAFAWTGGVALGLAGIALGLHARAAPEAPRTRTLAIAAGIAFGAAFLFRLDLVVAIGLAMIVLAWRATRTMVVPLFAAAAATASLLLVHLVLAGPANAIRGMLIQPVFDLRPGRRLPIPPAWNGFDGFPQIIGDLRDPLPWPIPTAGASRQLFVWFAANLAAIAVLVAVGLWVLRRDRNSIRARAVLVGGLFSLGMVTQSLQRPDSTHIAWVSCVSIALVPIALMEVLTAGHTGLAGRTAWLGRHARLVACALPALGVLLVLPNFSVRSYADSVAQTFGARRYAYTVERNGRIFYHGDPTVVDGANAMVPTLDRLVRPGDRLFVGPGDLRRTVTSEAWIYYLYPEAEPGTRYIEMDPGIANARHSGLAEDLRSSDVVVLSNIWREWFEPNDSVKPGATAATRVLAKDFCLVDRFGPIDPDVAVKVGAEWWFEVYRRCEPRARAGRRALPPGHPERRRVTEPSHNTDPSDSTDQDTDQDTDQNADQ